ncbi:MAG: RNA polymerase sigma factor [Longimicrobiales bacterium]
MTPPFHDEFVLVFDQHFARLFRYLDRLSGDVELAADLAQETFIKLHQRGSLPAAPEAWLITVAMNLFRNVQATRARRRRLLPVSRAGVVTSDPPALPDHMAEANETRARVRCAIDRLPERDRALLLLIAEGYSYHHIACALDINEASVGTLLARAKRAFRAAYQG